MGWVKSSFFKHRKFQDEVDLQAQLEVWHTEVNTQTPSRATGVIPEIRRQEELARLRPVKVLPETLPLRVPVVVGPTAEVMFEGVAYSMPPKAAHVSGTLFLYEHEVHVIAGRFDARHRRRKKGDPPAPLPEHRAEKIAAVHGTRAKLYEKRQQLLNLGQDALTVLTEITHREPKLSSRRVEELYALLEEYGDETLRTALQLAVTNGHLSVSGVKRSLTSSVRRGDGDSHRAGATQPRGHEDAQVEMAFVRAESKRGVS